MQNITFEAAIFQILKEDPSYAPDAYQFVREALDFTVKMLNKPADGPARHVSGAVLLEGIRKLALREFGPMALTVLNYWGVYRCEEFGQIVFHMVNKGILGKTGEDSIHDFDGGYDFINAFRAPFEPEKEVKGKIKNAE